MPAWGPLVVDFAGHANRHRHTDRATERRATICSGGLQAAVGKTFNEGRYEEMLDLVDSKPRVWMDGSRLTTDDIGRQADTQNAIHLERRRAGFDFARAVFRAPPVTDFPFAEFPFTTLVLARDLVFSFSFCRRLHRCRAPRTTPRAPHAATPQAARLPIPSASPE